MIIFVKGDVTKPLGGKFKYIVHVCNDIGAWGAGVSGAIGKRWPKAERLYRLWSVARALPAHENNFPKYELGNIQVVQMAEPEHNIRVVNLIGQRGIRSTENPHPVRYDAIQQGLKTLAGSLEAHRGETVVHMPRIGCGLAGGKWEEVEPIIIEELSRKDVAVYVYDLQGDQMGAKARP